ncbi:MAG: PGPGW domain-containing protein [Bryobacteraceae bacterium]
MAWLRLIAGFGLVLLGVIGLILPVMPGWLFLIPGLIILAERFPAVRRLLDWAKKKAGISTVT